MSLISSCCPVNFSSRNNANLGLCVRIYSFLFQFALYAVAVLFTAILGGYKCLGDVYLLIVGSQPSFMDYVGEMFFL